MTVEYRYGKRENRTKPYDVCSLRRVIANNECTILIYVDDLLVTSTDIATLSEVTSRLKDEYGVETRLTELPYQCSGWLVGDPETFQPTPGSLLAKDARERPVVLFPSVWDRQYCFKSNPNHSFREYA